MFYFYSCHQLYTSNMAHCLYQFSQSFVFDGLTRISYLHMKATTIYWYMDISIQIIDEVLMIFRQQPNTSNITGPPVVWIFQAGNWGAILYLSYNGIDFRSSAIMVFNIGERLEALRAEGKPFPDALRPYQVDVLSILLPNKTIFSLK